MAYCGEYTAVKWEDDHRIAVSLPCKAWTCAECAPNRKLQLMAQVCAGKPNKFLTITLRRSEASTPEAAAKKLSHAWRLLRLRMMRLQKTKSIPFFAVFERHKSGWPHLHITLRCKFISQRWIAAQMQDICNSPICWIENITSMSKLCGYIAKYMTKDPYKFGTSKRYWRSQDYDQSEEPEYKRNNKPGEGWEIWPVTLKQFTANQIELGYTVEQTDWGTVIVRGGP